MKKKERLFILCILLAAALLWLAMQRPGSRSFGSVRIEAGGEEFGIYSLAENQIIRIGDTNICEIKDGKIRMTEASCPDHLCIRQGAIDHTGGMIVCLPNKIVIEGVETTPSGPDNPEIDAVA